MDGFDIAVIGAGMAGASAACALAERYSVVLVERESQPGYHSTGRSAAMYVETYGNAAVRALTVAGRDLFRSPPAGFAEHQLVSARGSMFVGSAAQGSLVRQMYDDSRALSPSIRLIPAQEALVLCPSLRAAACEHALLDPEAMDIDVHALHQGYLRGARRLGARVLTQSGVDALDRSGAQWRLRAGEHEFTAAIVVNAAGAWADELARLAGARSLGLQPLRRTAITFETPPGADVSNWPAVFDIGEQWYFKPDAGRLLASPADETPSPPCDAQPEDYDVATAVDRIERATTLSVRRLASKWAGLRSFVSDHTPVIGFDEQIEGFFWVAGQGGAGIQTAPGAARAVSALIETGELPVGLRHLGLTREQLSPSRLR
ncbi:MAG: FAD-binding oxidoreductase [Betaproteobacteria bacterium]|nr:FAD-binding oxidoreductase [Betaproteobacteria bacterium]MBK9608620.1 FAD-binding oxidoreductase [Betaproteobacteria bacterium]